MYQPGRLGGGVLRSRLPRPGLHVPWLGEAGPGTQGRAAVSTCWGLGLELSEIMALEASRSAAGRMELARAHLGTRAKLQTRHFHFTECYHVFGTMSSRMLVIHPFGVEHYNFRILPHTDIPHGTVPFLT